MTDVIVNWWADPHQVSQDLFFAINIVLPIFTFLVGMEFGDTRKK